MPIKLLYLLYGCIMHNKTLLSTPPTILSHASYISVETLDVVQQLPESHKLADQLVQSIRLRSNKYRCELSHRLMVSPVRSFYGNYYEQSVLQAQPQYTSSGRAYPIKGMKREISQFSKESLTRLEPYLKCPQPPEGVLQLTVECLSVLSLDTDGPRVVRVLMSVECLSELVKQLQHLVSQQWLLSVLNALADTVQTCVVRQLLMEVSGQVPSSRILGQASLRPGAQDVLYRQSRQLSQIDSAFTREPIKTPQTSQGVQGKVIDWVFKLHPKSLRVPTHLYSYSHGTSQLHRTSLLTGQDSTTSLPHTFKEGCYWSELPGGYLMVTGGHDSDAEVVIDSCREFAVLTAPCMLRKRVGHGAVYHAQHLYVLGGGVTSYQLLKECERFVCAEGRWELLAPLPIACSGVTGVVAEESLYALGGYSGGFLNTVQKFSLTELTWTVMQLKLPYSSRFIPCFELNSSVFFVMKQTLYTLLPLLPVTTLPQDVSSWSGPSYYSAGTLYCSNWRGPARRVLVGSLS
jgi:hypothetical protein